VTAFSEEMYWHRLHDVKIKCRDFQDYVTRQGIFLTPELKTDFDSIADELWRAVVSMEVGKESGDLKIQHEGWETITDKIKPAYESVQKKIRMRLETHTKFK
jgi:hypothetical protein